MGRHGTLLSSCQLREGVSTTTRSLSGGISLGESPLYRGLFRKTETKFGNWEKNGITFSHLATLSLVNLPLLVNISSTYPKNPLLKCVLHQSSLRVLVKECDYARIMGRAQRLIYKPEIYLYKALRGDSSTRNEYLHTSSFFSCPFHLQPS